MNSRFLQKSSGTEEDLDRVTPKEKAKNLVGAGKYFCRAQRYSIWPRARVVQTTTPPCVYLLRLFKGVKIYNAAARTLFRRHVHTPLCVDTPLQSYFAGGGERRRGEERVSGYRRVPYVHTISLCTRTASYTYAYEYVCACVRVHCASMRGEKHTDERTGDGEICDSARRERERERSGVPSVLCGERGVEGVD